MKEVRARPKNPVQRRAIAEANAKLRDLPAFTKMALEHWAAGRPGAYRGNMILGEARIQQAKDALIHARVVDQDEAQWAVMTDAVKAHHRAAEPLSGVKESLKKTNHPRWGSRKKSTRQAAAEASAWLDKPGNAFYYGKEGFRYGPWGHVETVKGWENKPYTVKRNKLIAVAKKVDDWAAGDSASAKVFMGARGGKVLTRIPKGRAICTRCGGAGYLDAFRHVSGGVCFECGGPGVVESSGIR